MAFKLFTITCLLLPLINLVALATSIDRKPSAFKFLINLQGLQEGDKAQEIPQLRKYLKHFGYLSNTTEIQDTNNVFDQNIAYAIKTYQNFYRLKPTGTLDTATISMMMRPRCGVIDKIHATSNNFSHLLYSYFDDKGRWPKDKR
ncbi:metalloendoproteinase 1-like [Tripterygium wilfordii]|uniref:Metalloendoproteinase 1-like n=2 Tax=Tripterygium wilfordii TaxID=458696 RepID=A0A7J7C5G0_TRIWF|nr:metalloendoproteinase 1-like [Tripterygium wilfordii]